MLTDYLSFPEVRQAIGVEDDELTDDALSLPMYETELGIALAQVGDGGLQDLYLTVLAKDDTVRSAIEKKLYNQTRLYAVYSMALVALTATPLQAMKGEGDEKANYSRFGGDVHQQVLDRVTAAAERTLVALSGTYATATSVVVTRVSRVYMAAASPSYDPITG